MKRFHFAFLTILLSKILLLQAVEVNVDQLVKDFDTYAEEQRKVWKIPGMSIGIVKDDKVILSKGYGQRGLNDTRPVDENTIFQIGSLSKAFTAALVAVSIEKNEMKWDDKVLDHLPDFRLKDPWVTTQFQIEDLLSQRSGLPPYGGDGQALLGYSAQDILEHLHFIKPLSSFRSQFGYQNSLFVVAAEIIQRKRKQSYDELVKKDIFIPLEMTASTSTLKDFLNADNHAELHMRLADGSTVQVKENSFDSNWNYTLGPAGGINSNIKDMIKWMILQANQGKFKDKQLISADNMSRMTRPYVYVGKPMGKNMYYGLGWVHTEYSPYPFIWHDGGTLGVYNVAAFIPEERIGIIILGNVRNTQLSLALAFKFFDLYFNKPDTNWSQILYDESKKHADQPLKKPMNPTPAMPYSSYAGVYHNAIYGDVTVKEIPEGLSLEIGKKAVTLTMKHWDRDIFFLNWPLIEENGSKVIFISNDSGKIGKMDIEMFLKEGSGSFEKVSEK